MALGTAAKWGGQGSSWEPGVALDRAQLTRVSQPGGRQELSYDAARVAPLPTEEKSGAWGRPGRQD